MSLSESLAGVVSQLLLPTADGKGRRAVHEILLRTQGLPNVIREGNTPMLGSIIQSHGAQERATQAKSAEEAKGTERAAFSDKLQDIIENNDRDVEVYSDA